MPNLMRTIAAAFLILTPPAHAEDVATTREYWVSIASFEESANAEIARTEASGKLTERLSITPATTDSGYVLRLVAGPYFDRTMADQVQQTAHQAGYETAWIFSQGAPAIAVSGAGEYDAAEEAQSSDATFSSSVLDIGGDPSGDEASTVVLRSDFVPPPADPARNDPVLVEEAPADYSVHRLHRN